MTKFIYLIIFLFTSTFCFSQQEDRIRTIFLIDDQVFTIDRYVVEYNQDELLFPMELGDQLIIASEEFEYLPGGSYRAILGLSTLDKTVTQQFRSIIMNDGNTAVIEESKEVERELASWTTTGIMGNRCTKWGIRLRYQIILEDKTAFSISMQFGAESKSDAEKLYQNPNYYLLPGDVITFSNAMNQFNYADFLHYKHLISSITRNGKRIPTMPGTQVIGPKRDSLLGVFHKQDNEFRVIGNYYQKENVIQFDFFGNQNTIFQIVSHTYKFHHPLCEGAKYTYLYYYEENGERIYVLYSAWNGSEVHVRSNT